MSPRIVVAQAEGFPDPDPPWLPVGVTGWAGAPPRLVIIVKATFHYGDGELQWAKDQEPIGRGQESALPGAAPGELAAPTDFVPCKAGVDVLVTGHAFADRPADRIEGAVRVAGWSRPFTARAGAPSRSVPLSSTYLSLDQRLGPVEAARHDERVPYPEDASFDEFNAAPAERRLPDLAPDATITLEGLAPGRARLDLRLPGIAPIVTIDGAGDPDRAVLMRCDTLWIDTDREILALVWRGAAAIAGGAPDVARIVVSVEPRGAERAPEDRLAALQRGRLGFAVREQDLTGEAPPIGDVEEATLNIARYRTWASKAPPPSLPLAEYAQLAALLAEQPDARSTTLARHGLDEDRFMIEERAWLERMARAAGDGDATLADEFGKLHAEARDRAALPTDLDLSGYARLSVKLDLAEDPAAVLRDQGLSIPQWMRVDDRWTRSAEEDPAVAAALEAAIDAARAELEGGQA